MTEAKKLTQAREYIAALSPHLQPSHTGKLCATLPLSSVEIANEVLQLPAEFSIYSDPETGGKFLNTLNLVPFTIASIQELDSDLRQQRADVDAKLQAISDEMDKNKVTQAVTPAVSGKATGVTLPEVQKLIAAKPVGTTVAEVKKIAESIIQAKLSGVPAPTPSASVPATLITPELETYINDCVSKKIQEELAVIQKQLQENTSSVRTLNNMFRDVMPGV